MSVTNIYNRIKVVGPQPFWAADFTKYDFIFGYFWLAKVDFKIYFKTRTFWLLTGISPGGAVAPKAIELHWGSCISLRAFNLPSFCAVNHGWPRVLQA